MDAILLPTKFEITPGAKPNYGTLVLEPCFYGYGTTVGNALRRVLLSSLAGAAVTAVKIRGAQHEFSTLANVKEDVLDIILNLKLVRLRLFVDEPTKLSLHVKGEKKVTAGDFEKNANVEIVNPEQLIATLTDKSADFEMEVTVERGRGYVPTEARRERPQEIGMIMIDALFSPVRNVGYRVENVRVGEITNYDRLTMTIETDGTVTPEEAVRASSKTLLDYLTILTGEMMTGERPMFKEEVGEATGATLEPEPLSAEVAPMEATEVIPEEGVSDAEVTSEKPKKRAKKAPTKKK
ncbi:DNA-directed RNA polymerase subunit alpha [Candidatus Uhrbacteria bacterium]|nr:DNA-directed RNA polymerase subunit alpha [Candidatus Uhrbacteria bacterium]